MYERIDAPASYEERRALGRLSADGIQGDLAGEAIRQVLTTAPGDGQPIGGLKVVAAGGWFAARPSGTEPIYKIYAESFRGQAHLQRIQADAQRIVSAALAKAAPADAART